MTSLPELYPGFERRVFAVDGARIHTRIGGSGPPLLLLHGYPQTHACWHKVAPELARRHTLIIPDLRGYGDSTVVAADAGTDAYAKRVMARDFVAVMQALGHERFGILCHDRGGRVGYRLALDHPDRVRSLVTLDIVTTLDAWDDIAVDNAVGRFHWMFLARPAPFPETMIGHDRMFFLDYLLSQWTGTKDLSAFDPGALAHYRAAFSRPEVVHATCEDYRAGATIDPRIDAEDRAAGRKIEAPMLALWGGTRKHGFVNRPLDTWRPWCPHVRGEPVECGHFLPEEAPDATLALVMPFLAETLRTG